MKPIFLNMILIVLSLKCIGQTTSKIQKFYYNLPIDSCIEYIKNQITDSNLFKNPSQIGNEFRINTNFIQDNQQIDSVILKINCSGVAVGGSKNQISPIVYEQWITNVFIFKSYAAANEFFVHRKRELELFLGNPYLNEKNKKEIDYVYSLDTVLNRITYRQIHLMLEKDSAKVAMNYQLAYAYNFCNCK